MEFCVHCLVSSAYICLTETLMFGSLLCQMK